MTEKELILIHALLKTLERKTKTEGLYVPLRRGLEIVERELKLKDLERTINTKEDNEREILAAIPNHRHIVNTDGTLGCGCILYKNPLREGK